LNWRSLIVFGFMNCYIWKLQAFLLLFCVLFKGP